MIPHIGIISPLEVSIPWSKWTTSLVTLYLPVLNRPPLAAEASV
jgi:hypothetical protein